MDKSFFEKIHHKSDYQLPPSYNREIGRVIVRWAFFEHQVQAMIWAIAFASDPLGGALGRLSNCRTKISATTRPSEAVGGSPGASASTRRCYGQSAANAKN